MWKKFCLQFKKYFSEEIEFEDQKLKLSVKNYQLTSGILAFLMLIFQITLMIQETKNISNLIYILIIPEASAIISIIFVNSLYKYLNFFSMINSIIYSILIVEFLKEKQTKTNYNFEFQIGQIVIIVSVIFNYYSDWIYSCFSIIAIETFICFSLNETIGINIFVILLLILYLLNFHWFKNVFKKISIKKNHDNEKSISLKALDKIFPDLIAIINYQKKRKLSKVSSLKEKIKLNFFKIDFINEFGKEKFKILGENDLKNLLLSIKTLNGNFWKDIFEIDNISSLSETNIEKITIIGKLGENYFRGYFNQLSKESLLIRIENYQNDNNNKLKEFNTNKDKILFSITDNLLNPLNGINYIFDKLRNCNEKEELIKLINLGKANCEILMNLINDILDYSLVKNNNMKIIIKEFNVCKLVSEVISLMELLIPMKNTVLKFNHCFNNNFFNIFSDERRLKQVLINVIGNALKFTNKGLFFFF